ncbi:MAG: DUF2304 domain-containing protein [Flaviflexus sp.]|nr:DUF2304 domain-containing protein [Flaviflexus sp.]
MIIIIKVLLLVAILVAAAYLARATANAKNVALRRILLVCFVLIAVISILNPGLTTRVANFVGVGRGTDLLLYLLIIAFLSYSVASFRRMNTFENRITDLARELAIARSKPEQLEPRPDENHDEVA